MAPTDEGQALLARADLASAAYLLAGSSVLLALGLLVALGVLGWWEAFPPAVWQALPALALVAAWLALGLPLLGRRAARPLAAGLLSGAFGAAIILALGFSYERASEQPVRVYVWLPIAYACLAFAAGALTGLAARARRRASAAGSHRAAVAAIASAAAFAASILLAHRWFEPNRHIQPELPVADLAVAALVAAGALACLAVAKARRAA